MFLYPGIEISAVQMYSPSNSHDSQVTLKYQMLYGLTTATEVYGSILDAEKGRSNRGVRTVVIPLDCRTQPSDDLVGDCIDERV